MYKFCLYSNDLTISSKSFVEPKFNSSSVKNPFIFARHGAFNKEKKKGHTVTPNWALDSQKNLKTTKKIQSVLSLSNKLLFLHHSQGWHFTIFHNSLSIPIIISVVTAHPFLFCIILALCNIPSTYNSLYSRNLSLWRLCIRNPYAPW